MKKSLPFLFLSLTLRIIHVKYFEQTLLGLYKASNEEKFLSQTERGQIG